MTPKQARLVLGNPHITVSGAARLDGQSACKIDSIDLKPHGNVGLNPFEAYIGVPQDYVGLRTVVMVIPQASTVHCQN